MMNPTFDKKRWCELEIPIHEPAKRRVEGKADGKIEYYCQVCKKILLPSEINPELLKYLESALDN